MSHEQDSFVQTLRSAGQQNPPFQNIIDGYLRYYAGDSGHTARAKRLDLEKYLQFLQRFRAVSKSEKLRLSDWDTSSIRRFVEDLLERGEAPATVARRLATLKHMGRSFAENIPGFINPAKEVRAPKLPIEKPRALSADEREDIRQRARERLHERTTFIRYRNHVLFEMMLDTGLRAEEVRGLRLSQIDDDNEWIKNVRTKGKRYRNVYITSNVRDLFLSYLDRRSKELQRFYSPLSKLEDRKLPVFISTYAASSNDPESFLMGPKSVWRAIRELSAETDLHPHVLRHTFALDLLESSHDVRLVAQALGHSDVRTTMRYTERSSEHLAEALEVTRRSERKAHKLSHPEQE